MSVNWSDEEVWPCLSRRFFTEWFTQYQAKMKAAKPQKHCDYHMKKRVMSNENAHTRSEWCAEEQDFDREESPHRRDV